jgi:hypothetical protein
MKNKLWIFFLIIFIWAGLTSCSLHSNYELAQKEAERRNAAIAEGSSVVAIEMTGPSPEWTEEVLMGLIADRNELAIRVKSGGCTQKNDFWIWRQIDKESKADHPHYVLTVYRVRKDECKAFYPSGILIKFNLREKLGLSSFATYSVTNRLK